MSVDLKKIAAAFPEFQLSSKSRHDGALLLQLQAGHGNGDGGTLSFFAAGTDDAIIPPFHTADGKAMKREKVRDRQAAGKISATHIIANPTLAREWIVFFKKDGGRSYFLVDESDEVMSFRRLDDAVKELRGLGIKFAEIHL